MSLGRRQLVCLSLPVLAAACSSPEPVLYTLQVRPGPAIGGGPKVVEVRDIGLAGYLDRREVVRTSQGYRLGVMSNDWWGEALGPMLGRVIVLGLSQRLPGTTVFAESGAISADPNAIVAVNIQRLDVGASGMLDLVAQANVEFNRPTRSASQSFNISKPLAVPGTAGQVAASSEAMAELVDGLAAMLRS
jgi:uncharacterized protein